MFIEWFLIITILILVSIPWFIKLSVIKKIIFSITILFVSLLTILVTFIYNWNNAGPQHLPKTKCYYLIVDNKPYMEIEIFTVYNEHLTFTNNSGEFCIDEFTDEITFQNNKRIDTINLNFLDSDTIFIYR